MCLSPFPEPLPTRTVDGQISSSVRGCGASAIIRPVIALLAAAALIGPPVVVHDSAERSPLTSVGVRPGTFADGPVVYRRVADGWVQYWMAFARNDQDRGVLRTGRHAGDWEMVQGLMPRTSCRACAIACGRIRTTRQTGAA